VFRVNLQNILKDLDRVVIVRLFGRRSAFPKHGFDIAMVNFECFLAPVQALLIFIPFERNEGQISQVLHLQLRQSVKPIPIGGELLILLGKVLRGLL